ncbi:hypothetical protein D3C73_1018090 [compost metagenome]
MPQAFAEDRQRVLGVTYQRQHADELCATLSFRHVFHRLEQLGVVRRIAFAIGVAGRVDARRAAQEVHRQPRIIRQRRQTGNARSIAGLEDGVLDERKAGLFRLDAAEFANRAQLHRLAEHGLEFLEFAGVVAGQYELREIDHSPGKSSWLKEMFLMSLPICTLISKVRVSCCGTGYWAM